MALAGPGRRGVFFTLSAVLLMMIIITSFSIGRRALPLTRDIPLVRTRAIQTNAYLRSLESSLLPTILADSGRRAFLAMVNYTKVTGQPLNSNDVNSNFTELMMNGTINGTYYGYMANATVPERMAQVADLAWNTSRISTLYSFNGAPGEEFVLAQDNRTGPWHVRAEANVTLVVNATLMSWEKDALISADIPIEGLEDPYYAFQYPSRNRGQGKPYLPVIRRAPVSGGNWSFAAFLAHVRNMTYTTNDMGEAPDFLTRLTNRSQPGSECCGIEAPVNPSPDRLNYSDFASKHFNWSYIDHCLFGGLCAENLYDITGFTNDTPGNDGYGFRLRLDYLVRYNLSGTEMT